MRRKMLLVSGQDAPESISQPDETHANNEGSQGVMQSKLHDDPDAAAIEAENEHDSLEKNSVFSHISYFSD